jgi:tryptophan synthase alpha chain
MKQNRLQRLFAEKKEPVLAVYFMAGYPQRNDTLSLLQKLEAGGADLVEIGIPFSDPLADGPVIQHCGQRALENGMTLELLFEQLRTMRTSVSIPVVLMGYINPVLQFGVERFCTACREAGVDGVILPDLPPAEFETIYKPLFDACGINVILLITPQTDTARISKLDALSSGFVYAVSSSATTGKTQAFGEAQAAYFKRLQELELKNPVLAGFGIHNHSGFATATQYVRGAITGSAFLRHLTENGTDAAGIRQFIKSIKQPEYDYSVAP